MIDLHDFVYHTLRTKTSQICSLTSGQIILNAVRAN